MEEMIFPEIFDGRVLGFFTGKSLGTEVEPITGRRLYMPIQKHTGKVLVLDGATGPSLKALDGSLKPRRADAIITKRSDIMLGVQVADCVPILLYDRKKRVIAAVHAGWRGTAQGILKATIEKMTEVFKTRPADILMATGPAIRWCCYGVGADVLKAVVRETGKETENGQYHTKKDGRLCLDLPSANRQQALSMGVPKRGIWMADECTFCLPQEFHSYRYSKTHAGRQGGFIGLP